jgi:hypothetical protein
MSKPRYTVMRAPVVPSGTGRRDDPAWRTAQVAGLSYHGRSCAHRPPVEVRLLYDDQHLYVLFHVKDRYVKVVAQNYQDMVCYDSCVEFFVKPHPDCGYFNFEVNAGGCMLLYYTFGKGAADSGNPVPEKLLNGMKIHHSLPSRIDPEINEPVEWTIEYAIPLSLFEYYAGPLRPLAGQTWRANFYKCADRTTHPHWGMWSDIGKKFSYHQTEVFGELHFGK